MQLELLQRLKAANPDTPLIVVLMSGGALACPWCDEHADAVLWTGFNGQFAGTGLFDVLAGRVNPGGRMPYTVPKHVSQLPVITNYAYSANDPGSQDGLGRTYRWLNLEKQAPLYPFGYGKSFTQWTSRMRNTRGGVRE